MELYIHAVPQMKLWRILSGIPFAYSVYPLFFTATTFTHMEAVRMDFVRNLVELVLYIRDLYLAGHRPFNTRTAIAIILTGTK